MSSIRLAVAFLCAAPTAVAAQPAGEISAGIVMPGGNTLSRGALVGGAIDWKHDDRLRFGVGLDWDSASIDDNAYHTDSVVVSIEDSSLLRFRFLGRAQVALDADRRFWFGAAAGAAVRRVEYTESALIDPDRRVDTDFDKTQVGLAVIPSLTIYPTTRRWFAVRVDVSISRFAERRVLQSGGDELPMELGLRLVIRPTD